MSPEYKKQVLQYLSSNIKNGGFSFKIFPCDLIPNDHCDFRITEYSRDVFRVNQPGNLEFPRKFGLELKAFRPRYQSLSYPKFILFSLNFGVLCPITIRILSRQLKLRVDIVVARLQ